MLYPRWVVRATCKDTDMDLAKGRGDGLAIVEMYLNAPTSMNEHGIYYSEAIKADPLFQSFSQARVLRGDQYEWLDEGRMIKAIKIVKIEGLSQEQIVKVIHEAWLAEGTNLSRQLITRYALAGMIERGYD